MIVVIGEILIDIFPHYERIGGAPFNFAYHLKKMGFPVRFFTRVGKDRHAKRILDRLRSTGFDLDDVQIDPVHPTGTVNVLLDESGVPHFDICENVAWDHLDLDACRAAAAEDAEMIYFGSLVQRSEFGRREVQNLLAKRGKGVAAFCDINMRPPHVNFEALSQSLGHADILKLNEDELAVIQGDYKNQEAGDAPLSWLMETFDIRAVALTRGSRGSRLRFDGGRVEAPAQAAETVIDTVGAGDGFAAVLAAGYLRSLPWEKTVDLASRFASRICSIPGAVPDDAEFYNELKVVMEGKRDGS
ncbi:fructokinase [Desulfosarcina widdelii]|uniref:Fructokinase n=1 Tax=Desulfosarcina widdelii TaxID=947919 RepID=A0A5K7Z627_9BACT|nr:carbohydrate kinase [Desulfosarcina widdelii]BBO73894.1 fructokinase [Desulfosarcina widdelii]